ncbi:MAG: PhoH family protein [Zoogloeaceae bacterium]|jgi:phosphate starvation-inducible PhoH-like protein|nr:PhoH family protein [Zoogloeaceae bacterium]
MSDSPQSVSDFPEVFALEFQDNARLAALCGPLDENLRHIENALGTRITRRGGQFLFAGGKAEMTGVFIQSLYERTKSMPVTPEEIQLELMELTERGNTAGISATQKDISSMDDETLRLCTQKPGLRGRSPRQNEYLRHMRAHDIIFGVGPAGTGKTYLAVASAVDAFERNLVERIILTRPAVEAGERLGFLPGDLTQKVDPYLRPLYDALYDLMGIKRVDRLFEKGALEIAPLAFMRGRTLNRAFVILDEAQNTSPEQMKMFLTRIGFYSKAVINGDPSQVDLPKGQPSGLMDALEVLRDVKGVAFTRFTKEDVARHPLVGRIVAAYEARESNFFARKENSA